ncbi:hypothetical protein DSO57_1035176 [Entomophthora muscae]|uniref:Uncharacterized protein n=1 Tax=Entomophthora muscae TaxID=34485 RepID=A0ACC2REB4_9FUNG|nr:hypothetical protein DSO57_1035176 [Entomophthora muscae]
MQLLRYFLLGLAAAFPMARRTASTMECAGKRSDPINSIMGGELGAEEYATEGFINHNIDGPGISPSPSTFKRSIFAAPFTLMVHFGKLIVGLFYSPSNKS